MENSTLEGSIFKVLSFHQVLKRDWDYVLDNSLNGTFLHRREFIEYHGDRFQDESLLIYDGYRPIAIFLGEKERDVIYSHRGLTYAGWILVENLKLYQVRKVISETLKWFKENSIIELKVKMIPDFFAKSSQQILWEVLESFGFLIDFVGIHHCTKLPYSIKNKGKKWGRNKAKASGVTIEASDELFFFWKNILTPNLWEKHKVEPTHSFEEISYLKSRFPENILFFSANLGIEVLGGAVVFLTDTTIHLQYVSATEFGKKLKCLDYLMSFLIEDAFFQKSFFNMGVSHIPSTLEMNEGLVKWKKTLGGEKYEQKIVRYIF
ncbi:MAG: hypothetical protein ACXIUD_11720 [Mongoliitalea sp.]